MRLHEGLNDVWGLCCSLGSSPAVRTGQPQAKRGEKHPVCEKHELSLCNATEPTTQAPQGPEPTSPLLLTGEHPQSCMCLEILSGIFGAQGSSVNNINNRPNVRKCKSSILLPNYRFSENLFDMRVL